MKVAPARSTAIPESHPVLKGMEGRDVLKAAPALAAKQMTIAVPSTIAAATLRSDAGWARINMGRSGENGLTAS